MDAKETSVQRAFLQGTPPTVARLRWRDVEALIDAPPRQGIELAPRAESTAGRASSGTRALAFLTVIAFLTVYW